MSLKPVESVLTDPSKNSISVWLSTFQKCWLRSKWPDIYSHEEQKLLSNLSKKNKKKKRRTLRKQYAIRKQAHVGIFESKRNPITVIKAGELDVNIVEATGLPQSNINMVTTQSNYCKFYLTNNDPCYGDTEIYVTKPQKDESPKWDEPQKLTITNTTGKLIVELWEEKYHKYGEDELIGKVEIKLNYLVLHYCCNDDSNDIDDWFEVTLTKDKTKKESNIDEKRDDMYKGDYVQGKPMMQQILSLPVLVATDDKSTCRIRLQLKLNLISRFWSHFISHFDPILPQLEKIDFNANLCYIEIYKIYSLIDRVIIQGHTGSDIFFWRQWVLSIIALFGVACFVYYPWFLFFFLQLGLLIGFCTSYAMETKFAPKWKDKTKEFNLPSILHMICIVFGGVPAMVLSKTKKNENIIDDEPEPLSDLDETDEFLEPVTSRDKDFNMESLTTVSSDLQKQATERKTNQDENDDHESADMPKFAKFVVKRILNATESNDKLWFHQEVLVWINELLEYIKEVFQWKYVALASTAVVILFSLCVLSLLLHNTNFVKHQFMVIFAMILCFYSKPMQFLLWLGIGSLYYYENYYKTYKQYKVEQQPIFIRARPVSIDAGERLDTLNINPSKGIYKYIKFMMIPFSLLKDLFSGLFKFVLLKMRKKSKINDGNAFAMYTYHPSELCKISLIDCNTKYLCCESMENLCFSDDCTDSERMFISIPISSNKIGLKWCNGNIYISARSNGKITIDTVKLFECEIFEVIEQDDGDKISLRCHHQKYLSSDGTNIVLSQKSELTEKEKFVVEMINDEDDELTMQNVLPSDQITTRNTYLFVANEKKKATVIREQIIRNIINNKKVGSILAKLKSIKLLSF